ncbi:hypothetical protein AX17_003214 [Amanita inopinata Kibby_2008]|nr:hypothetical protein AX17_003214 [Amanita inopinata Kibby_2008]
METIDIPKTYGALLIGTLFASFLSGVTTVQSVVYFKLYPNDNFLTKGLVTVVWALDTVHSALIWDSMWLYLIEGFGDRSRIRTIPLYAQLFLKFVTFPDQRGQDYCTDNSLYRSPYFTRSFLLCTAHFHPQQEELLAYYPRNRSCGLPSLLCMWCVLRSHRIQLQAKSGWRVAATSAEMIRLSNFPDFKEQFRWLFSLGLALSSAVDVLITLSLFFLLWMSRSRSLSLNGVIDSMILYTFEIGSLTCFATIVSMICWLALSNNLIFLGLHFVIGKLYANSLMASLNTRHQLRRAHANFGAFHNHSPSTSSVNISRRRTGCHLPSFKPDSYSHTSDVQLQHVQINVEKSIQYDDVTPVPLKDLDGRQ